ncbi:MAG: Gfo/Idh/MocA family oxidoreductase [Spirochaetaceae bacterium]|jgi:predicted dehydrogenase|nr:Gfo/Idh/MocA family oxidoreductase [Spirochaetaceae bacterium]
MEYINWAIVGTGGIANAFIAGLPWAEGARVGAVVSRSPAGAAAFAERWGLKTSYPDYDAMLQDPSIQAVYLGIPHPFHKDYAIRALKAKKAVLCEKPAALNAGELSAMVETARTAGAFFMEAMWTRFVPTLCKVREWLRDGLIGEVKRVEANFCFNTPPNPESRLFALHLGGGALLDAGVYPISLASMVFGGKGPEKIVSLLELGQTGVDEDVSALISYGPHRVASVSAALSTATVNDAWIYGKAGRIHLPDFVFSHRADLAVYGKYEYHYEPEFVGNGYNYEAVAVMDCIRTGKTESEIMPWAESLSIAQTMDAIRSQWHFRYPGEASFGA